MACVMPALWCMLWPAEPVIQTEQLLQGAKPRLALLVEVRAEREDLINACVLPQNGVNICF